MMEGRVLRPWALIAVLLALAGCASSSRPDPTPLEPLTAKVTGRQLWSQSMGKVRFPLAVAVNGNVFTVADDGGQVMALEAESGKQIWRVDVNERLTAGVGSDGRFSSVVTRDNELVVVEGGKVSWRKTLPARVVTAPLVAGERVFVLAVDRSVHAFDAIDGRKLWSYSRPSDALNLASPGVLMPFKDTLVVGQGAKLAGLDPLRGTLRWEATVANPRGTNEVERLADLVGPAARVGDTICARAFQAAVACVNAERGSTLWSRNAGGLTGVGADEQMVVGGDASDRVAAWKASDGSPAWTIENLLYRNLTAPLAIGQTVVIGDVGGMVHWFARDTGEPVLRMPTDGSAITVPVVASGLTVLAVTSDGGLYAFRPN